MIQLHILVREDQAEFIRKLPGANVEHIRRAIDDYMKKMKKGLTTTSLSKKGDNNG